MTLKTTLLVWEPIVTSNVLASCVIGLDERLRTSMISTNIDPCYFPLEPICIIAPSPYKWNISMQQDQEMFGRPLSQAYSIWQWLVPKNMVLDMKRGWDHSHYMMHQRPTLWSLLKLNMFVSRLLCLWIGNRNGTWYMWTTFL
jgi:hypothetical protein